MSFVRAGAFALPFGRALLFSITLHLLVLMAAGIGMPPLVGESGVTEKKLPALDVSIGAAAATPAVRRPVTPPRPRAQPHAVDRAAVLATADSRAVVSAKEAIAPIPSGGLMPAPARGAVAGYPEAADVPAAAGSVVASSGEAPVPDGYLDAVRGYRIAVAVRAKRFRLYPPAAREMGIGGRSEIEIVVPVANSPEFRVRQSSGHEELDRAALEMLRRSVDLVEMPSLLRGRRLSITLPVDFLPPP